MAGETTSISFPTTVGPSFGGVADAFVSKVSGNSLVYSTFIGGAAEDRALSVAVDFLGSAYVVGSTASNNFPVPNGVITTPGGGFDAFVIKLKPAGTSINYGTYVGGGGFDFGYDIALDAADNAYITGMAGSIDFPPASTGAYDTVRAGSQEAYVVKLDPSQAGSASLVYLTFLGGSNADQGHGIAVDPATGHGYVTGQTNSTDFPVKNAEQPGHAGGWDAFVVQLNADASDAIFSTYIGGTDEDCEIVGDFRECDIGIDGNGAAYVAGRTLSPDLNTTVGAFSESFNGNGDVFALKLDTNGSGPEYLTYVGGTQGDFGFGIDVTTDGLAHIVGETHSGDYPRSEDPFDDTHGGIDAFVTSLTPDGRSLIYSTFLGGTNADTAYAIALDDSDHSLVAGRTFSTDFPVTADGFQSVNAGSADAFASIFSLPLGLPLPTDGTYSGGSVEVGEPDPRGPCPCPYEDATGATIDPINTRTGGFDYSVTDLSFQTSAGPMVFQRSYSSLTTDIYTTLLGFGWTHNHNTRLIFPDDSTGESGFVLFKAHSANRLRFIDNGDGTYSPYPGVLAALRRFDGPPVTYTVTDNLQRTYFFDSEGLLDRWEDHQGRGFHYFYDLINGELQIVEITDDTGDRYFLLGYDADGRIISVEDHTGRLVEYIYDPFGDGDLDEFVDAQGGLWEYSYDSEHRLTEVAAPQGSDEVTQVVVGYDFQGRAVFQEDGLGNRLAELTYNANGTTTLTDALGNSTTHEYDGRNTMVGDVDPFGDSFSRTFDTNFRPTSITNQSGNSTSMAWNADGANLLQSIDAEGGQTDMSYDAFNNLTQVVDPRGFVTAHTYDGTLLTSTTDALGNTTTYTYTADGNLASVTDARGNTTSYTYDQYGQRTSMTDALGNTWLYRYDDLGRLIETEDPFGRITAPEYDNLDRVVRVYRNWDPGRPLNDENQYNILTEYFYDDVGNQIEVCDTLGRCTQYEYDDANRLVRTIDPSGNITQNTYDAAGNLTSTTDALGRTTTFVYDEKNRLIQTIDPLGNATSTAFNPTINTSSTTDALGRTTIFEYDGMNRLDATTDALGNTATTTYDAAGNVVSQTEAAGRTTSFEYDALGRLIRETDPLGGVTEHFYDEVGNRVQTIDANGNATPYDYDPLNRLVSVTDPLGNVTTHQFDAVGNRVATTDATGNTTTFVYDALDRLVETIDPLGNSSVTEYDALGNTTAQTDANGNTTTFAYDILNRRISQTDALGGFTSFTYDAVGNQISITDPNGHTLSTSYDPLNRAVSTTDGNGNTTTNAYDAVGNLVSTTDPLGNTTTFEYDALNRQVKQTDPLGNFSAFTYDAVGNRLTSTDPNGGVTRFEYDDLDRVTAVVQNYKPGFTPDAETNVRTQYTYDAVGNRLTLTDALGNTTSLQYDSLNRLIRETDPLGNSAVYAYDAVGNRTQITDKNGDITGFAFDPLNRLSLIDYPAPEPDVSFAYDAAGNRTSMQDGAGTTTWIYDALNRTTSVTDPSGNTVGYSYDGVGNRTTLTYPDGKQVTYTYDAADRMSSVTDWDAASTSYTYDAANRLTSVSLPNGITSTYSYDAAGRTTSIFHEAGLDLISSYEYTYEPASNRVQAVENLLQPETPTPTDTPTATATDTPTAPDTATATTTPDDDDDSDEDGDGDDGDDDDGGDDDGGDNDDDDDGDDEDDGDDGDDEDDGDDGDDEDDEDATATSTASPTPSPTSTATDTPAPTETPTVTPTPEPTFLERTIDYQYDDLNRLLEASYSSGELFQYSYNEAGNTVEYVRTVAGSTVTTTYSYNAAYQLATAQEDGGLLWNYTYDDNGRLIETSPAGDSTGARRYSYSGAGYLTQVETHDGAAFQLQAEMNYNGLGDRLALTAHSGGSSLTTDYVLDYAGSASPLSATAAGQTTVYLYGLGVIGELNAAFGFYLKDLDRTVRQVAGPDTELTITRSFTPWGEPFEQIGSGDLAFGYFGGLLDTATGLLYVGSGQYYDPETGRFLAPTVDPFDPFRPGVASIPTFPAPPATRSARSLPLSRCCSWSEEDGSPVAGRG